MINSELLNTVRDDAQAGLSVYGVCLLMDEEGNLLRDAEGKKQFRFPPSWKEREVKAYTPEEVEANWQWQYEGSKKVYTATAEAWVQGAVSAGNPWTIDIDDSTLVQPFRENVAAERPYLLSEDYVYIEDSPTHGGHYTWSCDSDVTVPGSEKLALGPNKETKIETRGTGGIIITAPTPGYVAVQGDKRDDRKPISEDDLNFLRKCAESFNEYVKPSLIGRTITPSTVTTSTATSNQLVDQDMESEETTADIDNLAQAWMENKENKKLMKLEADGVVAKRGVRYTFKNCVLQPAISGQSGHNDMIRVASHIYWGLALSEPLADALINVFNSYCQPPFNEQELAHKIADAKSGVGAIVERGFFRNKTIKNGIVLELTKWGGTAANPTNLLTILMNQPELVNLKRDETTDRLVCDGDIVIEMEGHKVTYTGRFDDELRAGIRYLLDKQYNINPTDKDLDTALTNLSRIRSFNPILRYVESLEWDRVERLNTLMETYFDAERNAVNTWAPRMVFRGIFARNFRRNQRNQQDNVHLIAGNQGGGKTEYYTRLFTPRGNNWIAVLSVDDLTDPGQLVYKAEGRLLILCDEWVMTRTTQESLKSFLSQTEVPYRRVYAHEPSVFVKRFMVCGTTNEAAFLNDPTGARRFLITKANLPMNGSKVHELLTPAIVDQIWAEAYHDFLENRDKPDFLRLPREVEIEAAEIAETAQQVDPWEPLIKAYANAKVGMYHTSLGYDAATDCILVEPHYERSQLTAADIYANAFRKWTENTSNSPVKCSKKEAARIGAIIDNLPEWGRGKVTHYGVRTSGFVRVVKHQYAVPVSLLDSYDLRKLQEKGYKGDISIDEKIIEKSTQLL